MPVVAPPPRRSFVEQVMGLPVSVLVRGGAARTPRVEQVVTALYDDLRHADHVFSTYRTDSEVSRLRAGTLSGPSPALTEVLALCEQARQRTQGWFDPWLPDAHGVRRLDPSGLVKGWAVERAAQRLHDLSGHDWIVNAGGDVLAHAVSEPWRIGVEDPRDRSRVLAVVTVRSGAIATSGSVARGPHVLVPATGAPARGLLSATVVGPSLTHADVEATAAFAQGPHALPRLEAAGLHALLVQPDGSTCTTPGFPGQRLHD